MTIEDQLRGVARRAEEAQRPITVEEIIARTPGQEAVHPLDAARPSTARHRRRWALVAAAVVLVLAGVAVLIDTDDSDPVRVVTNPTTTLPPRPTTTVPLVVGNGAIAFAADAGGGAALTDPVVIGRVETVPEPMDIYVKEQGAAARRVISSGAHERCPTFSPDGERLAYLVAPGTRPGGSWPARGPALDAKIVVTRLEAAADPGDAELTRHVSVPWSYSVQRNLGPACPRWSPDSTHLAYLAQPRGRSDVVELRVLALDSGEEQVIASRPITETSAIAWSPTSDAIAFIKGGEVWSATIDGAEPTLVWHVRDGAATTVSWSSRGELAATAEGPGPPGPQVHIIAPDTGASALVDSPISGCGGPVSWSPDGSHLVFVHEKRIVISDRRGVVVRPTPPAVDGQEVGFCDVTWSPDGEELLGLAYPTRGNPFAGGEHPGMALVSLSPQGDRVDVLTPWTWAFDWISLRDASWQPTLHD